MKSFVKTALVVALAVSLTPAAHAATYQEELAQLRAKFKASDKSGDGKLSRQEAKDGGMTRLANNFSRVDTDGDGYVTLAQLEAQLAERHK